MRIFVFWRARAVSKFVEVLRPAFHHAVSFRKVDCAVIGSAVGVAYGVGKLVFDKFVPLVKFFLQKRPCHGSEPVRGHFFAAYPHGAQSSLQGAPAYGTVLSPLMREYPFLMACYRMQTTEHAQNLRRKGNYVRSSGFADIFGARQTDG